MTLHCEELLQLPPTIVCCCFHIPKKDLGVYSTPKSNITYLVVTIYCPIPVQNQEESDAPMRQFALEAATSRSTHKTPHCEE